MTYESGVNLFYNAQDCFLRIAFFCSCGIVISNIHPVARPVMYQHLLTRGVFLLLSLFADCVRAPPKEARFHETPDSPNSSSALRVVCIASSSILML